MGLEESRGRPWLVEQKDRLAPKPEQRDFRLPAGRSAEAEMQTRNQASESMPISSRGPARGWKHDGKPCRLRWVAEQALEHAWGSKFLRSSRVRRKPCRVPEGRRASPAAKRQPERL